MKLKSSHMILTLLAVALLLALFVSAGGSQDESLSDLGSRRDLASSSAGGDKGVVAIGTYHLKHTLAHDPRCFTQGLVYKNGFMYESCGLYGKSWLRKIDWQTGAVVHMYKDFDKSVFAEGITIIGGRLYMLTWQSRHLFVFDADTLQPLFTTRFHSHKQGEGWGLTTDGEHLIATDGSSRVLYLSVPTKEGEEATKVRELIVMESAARAGDEERISIREGGSKNMHVRDTKGEVKMLNDLEYVNGLLYANVWYKDVLVVIDPTKSVPVESSTTGGSSSSHAVDSVEIISKIDLADLYPEQSRARGVDCLNGIGWDSDKKEFVLTGKLWPSMYRMGLALTGGEAGGSSSSSSSSNKFQKRRRRRGGSSSSDSGSDSEASMARELGEEREGEGTGSTDSVPPPAWLAGMAGVTMIVCVGVCALMMMLVWIERGYDEGGAAERYAYQAAAADRDATHLSPIHGVTKNVSVGRTTAGAAGATPGGVSFTFGVDADDDHDVADGLEMQMPTIHTRSSYVRGITSSSKV